MKKSAYSDEDMKKDLEFIISDKDKKLISETAKKKILDHMAWEKTESNGKYKGLQYWTKDAIECYEQNQKDNKTKGLIHEHVYPRKEFINEILNKNKNIDEAIEKLNYLEAVVVTKKEANILNKLNENKWERYKKAGISEIYKIKWENNNKNYKIEETIKINNLFKSKSK